MTLQLIGCVICFDYHTILAGRIWLLIYWINSKSMSWTLFALTWLEDKVLPFLPTVHQERPDHEAR